MELMDYIPRKAAMLIEGALARGKGVLLLGPRQTGKTTLLERIPKDPISAWLRPPSASATKGIRICSDSK
jgi:hypothetical protein